MKRGNLLLWNWRVITENKFMIFDYIYIVHCEQHKDTNIYKVCRVQKSLEDLMDIQNSEMFYIFM